MKTPALIARISKIPLGTEPLGTEPPFRLAILFPITKETTIISSRSLKTLELKGKKALDTLLSRAKAIIAPINLEIAISNNILSTIAFKGYPTLPPFTAAIWELQTEGALKGKWFLKRAFPKPTYKPTAISILRELDAIYHDGDVAGKTTVKRMHTVIHNRLAHLTNK